MAKLETEFIPQEYKALWERCLPFLEKGRPGDIEHSLETLKLVLKYSAKFNADLAVLIPVAMMHDIGHSVLLPEHFKYVTGPEKIKNGKLVHMLAGAKIAHDILSGLNYDKAKMSEVVEIISMHDADQLEGVDLNKAYDSKDKKFFHDLDSLDRFNERRIDSLKYLYPDKKILIRVLEESLNNFFLEDFKKIARDSFVKIK